MKFHYESPETIQIRESRGLVKDVFDPAIAVRLPLSEYRTMLDLMRRDQTIATAYEIVVDFLTARGSDFIRGTKKERDEFRVSFEDLNFRQVSRNIGYSLCYYGDCFLEKRKNGSDKVNELWPLETTEMRIIYNEHGEVHGYVQRPFNMQNLSEEDILKKEKEPVPDEDGNQIVNPITKQIKTQGIFFGKDEVIHFRMKWVGSQVYSYNPNEPISTIASTKLYAGNYLMNIFLNMPPRYVAHLSGISNKDYTISKKEFQATKTNYKKTIAFTKSSDPQSKLDLKKIDPPYDELLIKITKWLNMELLKITRVPRSWIEESGIENRGVTEAEQRPFDVRIMALQRQNIQLPINKELLPQLRANPKVKFRFNEISRKGEKEILENAGMLMNFGVKPEALVRYFDERGILGFDPVDFDMERLKKDPETNPSRQRMNKSTSDMTQNRNEAGTSDKSAKKMGIK